MYYAHLLGSTISFVPDPNMILLLLFLTAKQTLTKTSRCSKMFTMVCVCDLNFNTKLNFLNFQINDSLKYLNYL